MFELSTAFGEGSERVEVAVQPVFTDQYEDVVSLTVWEDPREANVFLAFDEARKVAAAILEITSEDVAPTGSFNEAVVRAAVEHRKRVRFRYAKGADQTSIEVRTLDPVKVEDGLVTGYDPDRNGELRAYRLDRIKGSIRG